VKAAFITEPGPIENLVYGDLPDPEPSAEQVLVRVRAASVNRVDVFTREGSHGTKARFQHVPGLDLAGDVVGRGVDAARFQIGDRVMGTGTGGSYAQYAVAAEANLALIPEHLTYELAAAAPTAFCAAWHCLVCKASLGLGETVLVLAGGSGVGSAAIQIAKAASARVITTVGSDAKVDKARALGADHVILRKREDVAARARELTGGAGVDLVYDHVGQDTWDVSIASLKVGGRYVTNGVTSGHLAQIHLGRLWTRDLSVLGTTMRVPEDLGKVTEMIGRGVLNPVIDQVVPLEEAGRAHAILESNEFFGKVVLRVD
jgi:NADPH:quinone reductase-like Zn-dependent oxidoreductase